MTMKRFKYWVLSTFGAALYLVSVEHALSKSRNEEYVTGAHGSLSRIIAYMFLSFSILGMICWILPQRSIIKKLEVVLILASVSIATTASVYATIEPSNTLALTDNFLVLLPNIFLFGWFCVFCAVLLVANWIWHDIQKEEGVATIQWCLLTATSFVVMISSLPYRDMSMDTIQAFLRNETNSTEIEPGASVCEVMKSISCGRVQMGIIVGAISAGIAIPVAAWKNAPTMCQAELSFLLIILWVVGIAILTFETGQGRIMGNVYFGTWGSFFFSLDVFVTTMKAAQENTDDKNTHRVEAPIVANESDDIFGVAHDQLGQITRLKRQHSRQSINASQFRKRVASVMFSTVEEWNEPVGDNVEGTEESAALCPSTIEARKHKLTRLELWVVVLLLSCVCLAAVFPIISDQGGRNMYETLSIILPAAAIGVSFVGYVACLIPHKLSRYLDLGLACCEFVLWVCALLVLNVSVPSYGLDRFEDSGTFVNANQGESNSNVMLSAWGAFVISLVLCTSWFKASVIVTDWVLLGAFSFAMMVSSIFYYRKKVSIEDENGNVSELIRCEAYQRESCNRILFGLFLGLASGAISLVMMFLGQVSIIVHIAVSATLAAVWIIAVSLIAYGSGHGSRVGDVYLEVWASVFLCMEILTSSIVIFVRTRQERNTSDDDSHNGVAEDSPEEKLEAPVGDNKHSFVEQSIDRID